MTAFSIILTITLFLLPGVSTSFYRPLSPDVDLALVRRRRIALWLATAGAFAVYGFLLFAGSRGWFAARGAGPRTLWGKGTSPSDFAWALQFVLWWPFGVRVLNAVRPESRGPRPSSLRRTAALTPRTPAADLPRGTFVPGWVLVGFAGAAIAVRMIRGEPAAGVPGGAWWPCLMLFAGSLLPLLLTPLFLGLSTGEPEPLDPAASADLVSAYARLRRLKTRSLAAMGIGMSTWFAGLAVAAAYLDSSAALGLVAGIGGAVIGVCGGVLGTVAGSQRMRIRRRLDELTAAGPAGEDAVG